MSKLTDRLLSELLSKLDGDLARRGIDKHVQRVTVSRTHYAKALRYAVESTGETSETDVRLEDKEYSKAALAGINALEKHLIKSRTLSSLVSKTPSILVFEQPRFIQTPFNILKNASVNYLSKAFKAAGGYAITKDQNTLIKASVHRLHKGTTIGEAQLAGAIQLLGEKNQMFAEYIDSIQYTRLLQKYGDVTAKYKVIFDTSGGIKTIINKTTHISLEVKGRDANLTGSKFNDWKNIKPYLQKSILRWAKKRDSTPPTEELLEAAEYLVVSELLKVPGTSAKKKPTKPKAPKNETVTKSTGKAKSTRRVNTVPLIKARKKVKTSAVSLRSLIPALNARLKEQVAGNMGSPALNYQTGRFANSVRVVDITSTPKGHPSIAYTYQRAPYETFEYPGGKPRLATPDRDPRRIIDQSIREIAIGLISKQFFTRRV